MKKLSIILILCALVNLKMFCNVMPSSDSTIELKKNTLLTTIMYFDEIKIDADNLCYKEFLENNLPQKFVKPFYEFTKENKNIGIEIIGVGLHESGWRVFRGKVNNNGSVDLGPLMLNSFNIANESFMNAFATDDTKKYEYDEDIYYMCICINYYMSLRSELGPYSSLQVYNGGWRTQNKNCSKQLKKTVCLYADKVYGFINQTYDKWSEYKDENLSDCVERITNIYTAKINSHPLMNVDNKFINKSVNFNYDLYHYSFINNNNKIYKNDEEYYRLFILMEWPLCNIIYSFKNGSPHRMIIDIV